MTGGILLATDGSEHARRAGTRAVELASDRDVPLYVLAVVDARVHSEPGLSSAEATTIVVEERGHDHVRDVVLEAERRGVEADGEFRHGSPPELIIEYADEVGADLIVIGEHGDHDAHLGGVRRKLQRRDDVDVTVPGDEAAAARPVGGPHP